MRADVGHRGFTLIEVMVALVILAVVVLPLSGLAYQVGRRSTASAHTQHMAGALTAELGRLSVLPFDSLVAGTNCVTVSDPDFPHDRCVAIEDLSPLRRIMVVVTPAVAGVRPDSLVFERARPGGNPFRSP